MNQQAELQNAIFWETQNEKVNIKTIKVVFIQANTFQKFVENETQSEKLTKKKK